MAHSWGANILVEEAWLDWKIAWIPGLRVLESILRDLKTPWDSCFISPPKHPSKPPHGICWSKFISGFDAWHWYCGRFRACARECPGDPNLRRGFQPEVLGRQGYSELGNHHFQVFHVKLGECIHIYIYIYTDTSDTLYTWHIIYRYVLHFTCI